MSNLHGSHTDNEDNYPMNMQMTNRVPEWLTPIAWLFLVLALASAAAIVFDIYASRRRQNTVAFELMWAASALYLGPFALPVYKRYGRRTVEQQDAFTTAIPVDGQPAAVAGLPGGGASAIAHLAGVPLVIASGLTIAGINLWVMILVIGVLAMILLFFYERVAAGSHGGQIAWGTAVGAAVLTVLAFDIGMGGWMLLLHFNEFMPPATDATFWFLMQVGIVLGMITGYPAVKWLTQRRQRITPV